MSQRKHAGSKTKKRSTRRRTTARPARTGQRQRLQGPFKSINSQDPIPATYKAKFHYAETWSMPTGAGGVCGVEAIYRLNSCYDPNYAGIGGQPYGWDQLSPLYRKYKVNSVFMSVTANDPSEDGLVLCAQVQAPNGVFTLGGKTLSDVRAQPMAVTRNINNSGSQVKTIKQYFPVSKISGLTALQFKADNDLFCSDVTADPAACPYLRVALGSDRGSTGATVVCTVKLVFYCTLYERKVQGPS